MTIGPYGYRPSGESVHLLHHNVDFVRIFMRDYGIGRSVDVEQLRAPLDAWSRHFWKDGRNEYSSLEDLFDGDGQVYTG